MNTYEIEIYRGDTKCFGVEWLDADENPKDLQGYTPCMQVRDRRNRLVFELTLNDGIEINEHDEIIVTLIPERTEMLNGNASYEYDLEMRKSEEEIETILRGCLVVTNDITTRDEDG